METKIVAAPNISCGHCTMRIEKTLQSLPGVTSAHAEVSAKTVTVTWDNAQTTWPEIAAALKKIGYPAQA